MLSVIAAGLVAWFTLPWAAYPDPAFPRIAVLAEREGESIGDMLLGVTRPIEAAVGALPGLARLRSRTTRGASELSLEFTPETDARDGLARTRACMDSLRPGLPSDLKTTIERVGPAGFPVISFHVRIDARAGEADSAAPGEEHPPEDRAGLRAWVRTQVEPRLARLPDVLRVKVEGDEEREILVEADPSRLASVQLSIMDLVRALRGSESHGAVGGVERDHRQVPVLVSGEMGGLEDVANLPIAARGAETVRVRDVAEIREGSQDRKCVVTGSGREAIVISLFLRPGGRLTDLSDRVRGEIAELEKAAPRGLAIVPVYDQAELVRGSLAGARDAILFGLVLVFGVTWVILGSWRTALRVTGSASASVLGALALMALLGLPLDLMSAGGIFVALGLVIGDAVMISGHLGRERPAAGESRASAGVAEPRADARPVAEASATAAKIQTPGVESGASPAQSRGSPAWVIGSSLAMLTPLLSLAWLEGLPGTFLRSMATALALGIAASVLVSRTVTCGFAAGRPGPCPGIAPRRGWIDRLEDSCEATLRGALRRSRLAAAGLAAALALGLALAGGMEIGFLPAVDEGGVVIEYSLPAATSLTETDAAGRRIEQVLARTAEVLSWSRRTGTRLGLSPGEPSHGVFLVRLILPEHRKRSTARVLDRLRRDLAREAPQVRTCYVTPLQVALRDRERDPAPIEVEVSGPETAAIQTAAKEIADGLQRIPGIEDVTGGDSLGSPEMTWRLDRDAVARAGLTGAEVEDQMRVALNGLEATRLRLGDEFVPVMVRFPDRVRRDPDWLARLPIVDRAGRALPATALGGIEERTVAYEQLRQDLQPLRIVAAGGRGTDFDGAQSAVRALLERLPRPAGVRCEVAGGLAERERAWVNVLEVLATAAGGLFLALAVWLRSWRLPLVIFLSLPFPPIGALVALRSVGMELDVSACLGFVLLIGLTVKSAMLLIARSAQVQAETGCALDAAVTRAARDGLRPILATSAAVGAGLAPLALGSGTGAGAFAALAVVALGGLLVFAPLTLLVVPVVHRLVGAPAAPRPVDPGLRP